MKNNIIAACCFFIMGNTLYAQNYPLDKARDLVSKMTLDEKINLVVGNGMIFMDKNMSSFSGDEGKGQIMDKVSGAAGSTYAIPRLNIPNMVLADGPAGLRIDPTRPMDRRTYYATAFPIATSLACSWNKSLVESVGKAMGNEVKEYGVDILLAPALNIHRNPLGGRNFEYYSEDPVLAGNITAAMVNGIQSNGVGTSIKHFAANNQETNRTMINTIVSERALREIYLRPFEIAVKKSQPWTVMSSYNKINGLYTSEDPQLLNTILRKEWGFQGLVTSDWFGGKDAVAQMKAGNDLLMPGSVQQKKSIADAIASGMLDVKVIDENASRILSIIMTSPSYQNYAYSNKPDLPANAKTALRAAAEGMVLLKNSKKTLPMHASVKRIALYGNASYNLFSGGSGSGDVNEAYTVSLMDGLTSNPYDNNPSYFYQIDSALLSGYQDHISIETQKQPKKKSFLDLLPPLPEMQIDVAQIEQQASINDMAIFTIGRNAGECQDRNIENDFQLSATEKTLIQNISTAFHAKGKKLVVILNIGGVIEMASWVHYADAVLLAWQSGQEAGRAIADILIGKYSPSGKLSMTFPLRYEDVPSARNFPGKNLSDQPIIGVDGIAKIYDSEVTYEEGIYVGYRYYDRFKITPAYEFGYGLSYTSFRYGKAKLSSKTFKDKLTISVEVTNTGDQDGKEVVQLYLSAPQKNTDKPLKELKSFEKTKVLQPGETQTLSFTIEPKDLASYDTKTASWIAEAGNYTVEIGSSSRDIRSTVKFSLSDTMVVEKCNRVMTPSVEINELK
jgi:beta-glucosidase